MKKLVSELLASIKIKPIVIQMSSEENKTIEPYSLVDARVETGRFAWLDTILRRWAHLLETTLFEKLGVMFEIEAPPAEWMRFEQFCEQITQQPLYIFETQFHGEGILAIDNKFAHACLISTAQARLNNQSSDLPDLNPRNHKKLHLMLQHILKDFEKSWTGIAEVKMVLKKVTSHRFRAKIMIPFEQCIVASLSLQGHGFSTNLTLCFPYLSLDSIFQKQSQKKALPPESLNHYYPELQGHFDKMLQAGQYEVVAELGTVDVQSHAPIQVGDILPLDSIVGKELVLKINGVPVLTGEVGQAEEHYAAKVIAHYETKKEEYRKRPRTFSKIQWPQA